MNILHTTKYHISIIPILEIGDLIFAQSQAIVRYLSKKYNICGNNELNEFYADMIFCGVQDIHYKFNNTNLFKQNETTFLNEELPKWSGYFENLLKKNNTNYFVGDNLTYADLAVFNLYDDIETKYPNSLKNLCTKRAWYHLFAVISAPRHSTPTIDLYPPIGKALLYMVYMHLCTCANTRANTPVDNVAKCAYKSDEIYRALNSQSN
ncbi:glutathione S-transferase, putative (GST) [Plasmodium ovale wallikeri]|uniref:Glutathione S-transferase, putative (GST) n=1 Tax=Plasmodium ovale wallikeri TaxID=864142 RepID=A0A1A8ZQ49_PLAOA|nr:glutathione S-transferase, putative (GST) [Plasmodium ovale wallikeri]